MTSSRQLQAASFRSIGGTSGRLRSSTGSSGGRWPSAGLGWDSAWVIRSLIGWFLSRSLLAWLAVAGPAKPSQGGHTGGRPTVPAARRPTLYQRDYLMRQIEQVGRMLAAIIGLAKGGRGDEALGMFDEAYKPLVGVGSRVVAVLGDAQLVDMLTSGSNPDMRRVALALDLLKAEADLYAEAGQEGETAIRYRRAGAPAGTPAPPPERPPGRGL